MKANDIVSTGWYVLIDKNENRSTVVEVFKAVWNYFALDHETATATPIADIERDVDLVPYQLSMDGWAPYEERVDGHIYCKSIPGSRGLLFAKYQSLPAHVRAFLRQETSAGRTK